MRTLAPPVAAPVWCQLCPPPFPRLSLLQGDPALLQALAIEVLLPGVRVGLPEDLAAEAPGAAAAGAPATGGKQASPAGKRRGVVRVALQGRLLVQNQSRYNQADTELLVRTAGGQLAKQPVSCFSCCCSSCHIPLRCALLPVRVQWAAARPAAQRGGHPLGARGSGQMTCCLR